jgi:SanA protein
MCPFISMDTFIYREIIGLPKKQVWLLLGTTPSVEWRKNIFFEQRILASKQLYDANKIEYIIASWDNAHYSYNEPELMKQALIKAWIPEERIILDYAGFRTLDSVVRAKEVFSQTGYIIISQDFHLERALYIARNNWIDAYGYSAGIVPFSIAPRVYIREAWARLVALFDVFIGVSPKFLGEKISVTKN